MTDQAKSIQAIEPLREGWTVEDLRRWLREYNEWRGQPELARAAGVGGER